MAHLRQLFEAEPQSLVRLSNLVQTLMGQRHPTPIHLSCRMVYFLQVYLQIHGQKVLVSLSTIVFFLVKF